MSMDSSRYTGLYTLQDEVLAVIFEEPAGFYLTGGTALSRFYLNHRYSDDLDFFNHDIGVFPDAFRLILSKLVLTWPDISVEVDGRDFKRLRIGKEGSELKLDFVADRVQRIGLPAKIHGIYVDTVRNILSNKLCAALGRDEGRDIADILYISRARKFSWDAILRETLLKEGFQLEDLLFRLGTFPVKMLQTVPFVTAESIDAYAEALARIRSDIYDQAENSLAGSTALAL
jgi:predicted nucleotidyltransferase component of viral defense system